MRESHDLVRTKIHYQHKTRSQAAAQTHLQFFVLRLNARIYPFPSRIIMTHLSFRVKSNIILNTNQGCFSCRYILSQFIYCHLLNSMRLKISVRFNPSCPSPTRFSIYISSAAFLTSFPVLHLCCHRRRRGPFCLLLKEAC